MYFVRILFIGILFSVSAFAGSYASGTSTVKLNWPKEKLRQSIPIGATGTVRHESLSGPAPIVLLGRYENQDRTSSVIAIYQTDAHELHYLNPAKTKMVDQDGQLISLARLRAYVQPLPQDGETCACYTLYNYLRQISLRKNSPQILQKQFSNESLRSRMIEQTNFEMYQDEDRGLTNALQDLAANYSLRYLELPNKKASLLRDSILSELNKGWSVLFRFNVASAMFHQGDIDLWDDQGEYPQSTYNHIWLPADGVNPRPIAEGHAIVALGSFKVGAQTFIVVADPNFGLPRLWKAEYFSESPLAKLRAFVLWYKAAPLH